MIDPDLVARAEKIADWAYVRDHWRWDQFKLFVLSALLEQRVADTAAHDAVVLPQVGRVE